jgi:hypothetical protein
VADDGVLRFRAQSLIVELYLEERRTHTWS